MHNSHITNVRLWRTTRGVPWRLVISEVFCIFFPNCLQPTNCKFCPVWLKLLWKERKIFLQMMTLNYSSSFISLGVFTVAKILSITPALYPSHQSTREHFTTNSCYFSLNSNSVFIIVTLVSSSIASKRRHFWQVDNAVCITVCC